MATNCFRLFVFGLGIQEFKTAVSAPSKRDDDREVNRLMASTIRQAALYLLRLYGGTPA
jgi:hypothetical protein